MELIVISRTKLKVMLSAEDMKKFDFDPCGGGDPSGRSAFRNILKEAREKCGFDAVGERVFVQYYPEKHGGCEMFVTKLSRTEAPLSKETHGIPRDFGYIVYRFAALEGILALCSRLKVTGNKCNAVLFVVEEGKRQYFLVVEREIPLAGEYGGVALGRAALCYLNEHGRRICSDAVNNLAEFH